MLKPANFDPNWRNEMTRYNEDPHAYGAPQVRVATTQEQLGLTRVNFGGTNHGTRTRQN